MKFDSFTIDNFKGIKSAKIDLLPSGSNIFTLIGLNESGKTTILEAINAFGQSREDTKALYATGASKEDPASFVPKQRKSNFSGAITIRASVSFEGDERDSIISEVEETHSCKIEGVPTKFEIRRSYKFENSDYKEYESVFAVQLNAKAKGSRKFTRQGSDDEIWKSFATAVVKLLPRIVYFPTFLFTQPQRIYLNPAEDEDAVNRHYREIIQSVAHSLPSPLDIKKHIVDRVLTEETLGQKVVSMMFLAPDKQEQIDAALNELAAHLSITIFNNWSKIFGGRFNDREIVLKLGVTNDERPPRVYIQFALKHKTSTYDIAERSLGFRWFFSFLLFTLYRTSAKNSPPTLFLLDEPASNLHSRAQMQLVASLPKIAAGRNQIIYSTHSHYMINPDWLDQAFIVSNRAVDYEDVSESDSSAGGQNTDVHVEKYRSFVGKNPDKTTYFQPVLDKLDVVPSKIDLVRPSVLMEGKADYLIIEYGRRILLKSPLSFATVPTRGAAGMDELIGLFLGWSVPFVVCLDDDKAGKLAAKKYKSDWAFTDSEVFTLGDVDPSLSGKRVEDFLEESDLKLISGYYEIEDIPSKSQIQLFFSEMLAKSKELNFSDKYRNRIAEFDKKFSGALKAPTPAG